MKQFRLLAAAAAVALVAGLSACAPTTPAASPSTVGIPVLVSVNDLQGETVEVAMNQAINISTESLDIDSYTAEIADPSIVEFVQGQVWRDTVYNPGLRPLKTGTTQVTMTNEQEGIQPLTFTVVVTE